MTAWEDLYYRVRTKDGAVYWKAIHYAEGVSIEHKLSVKVAADIERAMMAFADEILPT